MSDYGMLPVMHPQPFYGDPADVPERPPIIAGVQFRVPSSALGDLRPFVAGNLQTGPSAMDGLRSKLARSGRLASIEGGHPSSSRMVCEAWQGIPKRALSLHVSRSWPSSLLVCFHNLAKKIFVWLCAHSSILGWNILVSWLHGCVRVMTQSAFGCPVL